MVEDISRLPCEFVFMGLVVLHGTGDFVRPHSERARTEAHPISARSCGAYLCSKLSQETLNAAIASILKASQEKKRNFVETIELQISKQTCFPPPASFPPLAFFACFAAHPEDATPLCYMYSND